MNAPRESGAQQGASGTRARFGSPRRDASEHVAFEIRRYLSRRGLAPGERLGTEQELAVEFGVSRPTLREGLRLLAGSHLIRSSQGRGGGIFVESTQNEGMGRNVSDSIAAMLETDSVSLDELLDARLYLEVPLAGLAAQHATETTAHDLDDAIAAAAGWCSRIARRILPCWRRIASPSIEPPIVSISDGCSTSRVQLVKARSSSFRAVDAITRWNRVSAMRNASEAG